MRLVNNGVAPTPGEGRIEVYEDGQWGSICEDIDWDIKDVSVICRQLGYIGAMAGMQVTI